MIEEYIWIGNRPGWPDILSRKSHSAFEPSGYPHRHHHTLSVASSTPTYIVLRHIVYCSCKSYHKSRNALDPSGYPHRHHHKLSVASDTPTYIVPGDTARVSCKPDHMLRNARALSEGAHSGLNSMSGSLHTREDTGLWCRLLYFYMCRYT